MNVTNLTNLTVLHVIRVVVVTSRGEKGYMWLVIYVECY